MPGTVRIEVAELEIKRSIKGPVAMIPEESEIESPKMKMATKSRRHRCSPVRGPMSASDNNFPGVALSFSNKLMPYVVGSKPSSADDCEMKADDEDAASASEGESEAACEEEMAAESPASTHVPDVDEMSLLMGSSSSRQTSRQPSPLMQQMMQQNGIINLNMNMNTGSACHHHPSDEEDSLGDSGFGYHQQQQQHASSSLSSSSSFTPGPHEFGLANFSSLLNCVNNEEMRGSLVPGAMAGISPSRRQGGRKKECVSCKTTDTPMWRDSAFGERLCNACGIRWKKYGVACLQCRYVPRKYERMNVNCKKCGSTLPPPCAQRNLL